MCGRVAAATFASDSGGRPTFLNLGRAHPNQDLTILIWEEDRDRYPSPPEELFLGQDVCVAGVITQFDGTPQIEAEANLVQLAEDTDDASSGSSDELDCSTVDDDEMRELCEEIAAEIDDAYDDLADDALDDYYDSLDDFYAEDWGGDYDEWTP